MGRKEKYQEAAAAYMETVKKVCAEEDTPYQVCFAQLMVEVGGSVVEPVEELPDPEEVHDRKFKLASVHNLFGLKYPKGKSAKKLWEYLGKPGKVTKMTPERIKIKDQKHLDKLLKRDAKFDDDYLANPTFGGRVSLMLPDAFCTFPTLEAGIRGWCLWMKRSRYQDGGILRDDPVRWIAYRWMRGYATADHYVEAVVKRMRRCAEYLGDRSFDVSINDALDNLLDEARTVDGRDRWNLAKDALEDNSFTAVPTRSSTSATSRWSSRSEAMWRIDAGVHATGITLMLPPGVKALRKGINQVYIGGWDRGESQKFLRELSDLQWRAAVEILTGDMDPEYEIIEKLGDRVLRRSPKR
jgi:hypothetical protein